MRLLSAFVAWVIIMFIEVVWLVINISGGARNKEEIYVVIIISLVMGATGLNLYSNHLRK
ncbi:hypothetical protein [Aquibacillus salsiterrae]|uniref:Uncharacterized protein n=1 Tax=Aquibacillus salsiterrae TaxID=2950439 RepID=A0A9X4AHJ4_9BACI|nr:hypothetical protein [Aquibacillus salsiterrae]MDC3418390.1 hypothetical protein [Aquibacillus salsiterrae]